jgi:hypothetical protein
MSEERDRRKAELLQRQREMGNLSDFRSGYFRDDVSFQAWRCTEAKHKIDILTWPCGKFAKRFVSNWEEGTKIYALPIYVHFNVGPDKEAILCVDRLKWGKGLECPTCKERVKKERAGKSTKEEIKDLTPKLRTLYNIIVWDSPEEKKKGPQVWDVSHFFMEKELQERAEDSSGRPITWADDEEGRQIHFKQTGKGKGRTEFTGHTFVERDYSIPQKWIDKCVAIDELMHFPTQEELDRYQKFYDSMGDFVPDEDDDNPPRKKASDDDDDMPPRKKKAADDDDDMPPRKKKAADDDDDPPRKKKPVDDDDDDPPRKKKPVDDDDDPPRKKKAADDDDDPPRKKKGDDDDEPKKKPSRERECPEGGTYGKDFEKFKECTGCKYFAGCSDASDEFVNDKPEKKKKAADDDDDPPRKKKPVDDDDDPPRKKGGLPERKR